MRINISSAIAKMIAIYEINMNTIDLLMLEFILASSSSNWLIDINQKLRKQTDIDKNIMQKVM